jgi:hypothetical protein
MVENRNLTKYIGFGELKIGFAAAWLPLIDVKAACCHNLYLSTFVNVYEKKEALLNNIIKTMTFDPAKKEKKRQ